VTHVRTDLSEERIAYIKVKNKRVRITDYFHPDDGGSTFVRNVGSYKSHRASHPRGRAFLKLWYVLTAVVERDKQ
jgi:hypothetical protein